MLTFSILYQVYKYVSVLNNKLHIQRREIFVCGFGCGYTCASISRSSILFHSDFAKIAHSWFNECERWYAMLESAGGSIVYCNLLRLLCQPPTPSNAGALKKFDELSWRKRFEATKMICYTSVTCHFIPISFKEPWFVKWFWIWIIR